jgi:hypothetical protein
MAVMEYVTLCLQVFVNPTIRTFLSSMRPSLAAPHPCGFGYEGAVGEA